MDLKIYYTSDLHGFFYPTSYGDRIEKNQGLFKCYTGFEKDENTLLIDGGDILQGSAFSYYCSQVLHSSTPIAEIMNACGYDFYTLGNHDFNYGQEYFENYIKESKAKCICQNVTDEYGNVLFPYTVKIMPDGLRVGIVGIVTDYVNIWEKKENIQGIKIVDPFCMAAKALKELKMCTDLTIALYHGGFECDIKSGERLSDTTENIGYKICRELDFDILLTGHQHMSIDGQLICGTYVVQPAEYGKEYHEIVIDEQADSGKWRISSERRKAIGKADACLSEKFSKTEDQVQKWLDQPLGRLNRDLLPADRLQMALYGSPIADFLNMVQLYYSGAQISAVGLANEITGFHKNIRTRDIISTYPYPNTLVVLEITGEQLKKAMERSAEYFVQDEQGNSRISNDFLIPKVEHYNYDYYMGVEYHIDPGKMRGDRICDLSYEGKAVTSQQEFTLCINNYRATGAGGYEVYKECRIVKEIEMEMSELIMNYFAKFPVINL